MNEHDENYNQLDRERMFSLADMIEEILRKIWLIIVLAVVFAVLCAGYKYMSDRSKAAVSSNTNSYAETVGSLSEEQLGDINSVLRLYREVDEVNKYMSESIRMQIDPYSEDRVTMQFDLQTDDENLPDVMQAVDSYVSEGAIAADLQESYPDVESRYLAELISVTTGSMSTSLSDSEINMYMSSLISVQVIDTDADAASRLADEVQQCLTSYVRGLQSHFGSCQLELVDQTATQVYDSSLKSEQTSVLNNQITQQNKIDTQIGYLDSSQVTVLNATLAQGSYTVVTEDDSDAGTQAAAVKVHISRRYTLLGILIGVVLGIIIIIIYYIARGALNVAQEMPGEFGISLFGQLHEKKQRNPLVRGWRRLVYKRKPLPPETERQIILANMRAYCKNHGVERILLTGSRMGLSEDEHLAQICEALAAEGIEAEIADGLTSSPDALERMEGYDFVALVETIHRSHYRDIVREVEFCGEQSVQLAGAIVLD